MNVFMVRTWDQLVGKYLGFRYLRVSDIGQTPVSDVVLPASHPACAHGTLQTPPCHPFHHYRTTSLPKHRPIQYSLTQKNHASLHFPFILGRAAVSVAASAAAKPVAYVCSSFAGATNGHKMTYYTTRYALRQPPRVSTLYFLRSFLPTPHGRRPYPPH